MSHIILGKTCRIWETFLSNVMIALRFETVWQASNAALEQPMGMHASFPSAIISSVTVLTTDCKMYLFNFKWYFGIKFFLYSSIKWSTPKTHHVIHVFTFSSFFPTSYCHSVGIYDNLHSTMLCHRKGKLNAYSLSGLIWSGLLTEIFPVAPELVTRNQWWRQRDEVFIALVKPKQSVGNGMSISGTAILHPILYLKTRSAGGNISIIITRYWLPVAAGAHPLPTSWNRDERVLVANKIGERSFKKFHL